MVYSCTITNIGIILYNYQYWSVHIQLPILVYSLTVTNIGIFTYNYKIGTFIYTYQYWYLHMQLPILQTSFLLYSSWCRVIFKPYDEQCLAIQKSPILTAQTTQPLAPHLGRRRCKRHWNKTANFRKNVLSRIYHQ